MSKTEVVQRWIERVSYDIDTAKAMLRTKRYIYAVFMCQQFIEKCLKALLAYKEKEILPIHNLRRLSELTGIINELDETILIKLDFLSKEFIKFTEEFIKWLYQRMK